MTSRIKGPKTSRARWIGFHSSDDEGRSARLGKPRRRMLPPRLQQRGEMENYATELMRNGGLQSQVWNQSWPKPNGCSESTSRVGARCERQEGKAVTDSTAPIVAALLRPEPERQDPHLSHTPGLCERSLPLSFAPLTVRRGPPICDEQHNPGTACFAQLF